MWEPCCRIVPSTYVLGCPCFFTAQTNLTPGCLGCIREPDRGIQRQSWAIGRLAVLFRCTSGILAAASACLSIISSTRGSWLWGSLIWVGELLVGGWGGWSGPYRWQRSQRWWSVGVAQCTTGTTWLWPLYLCLLFLSKPLRNLGYYLQMGLMEREILCSPDFQTHCWLVFKCFLT